MGSRPQPKIIFYTNDICPWAHRAQITLSVLGLPYEKSVVDLAKPRTPAYLAVNPRGLVPSLSYDGAIVTESAIVSQFLADAHPEAGLAPASDAPGGALHRARLAFFADTYMTKVQGPYGKVAAAGSDAEAEALVPAVVAAVKKEIEPLLVGAGPFFGGSATLTIAEALTAPFVLRLFALAKADLLPASLATSLAEQTPNFYAWAQAVIAQQAVIATFPAERIIDRQKASKAAKAEAAKAEAAKV